MKHFLSLMIVLLIGFCLTQNGISQQSAYWQQKLQYKISVELDEQQKILDGQLELTYTNHSPDTLPFIWFHIWPNAYSTDRSAFSEQLLLNGNTSFYFSDEEQRGYIRNLQFTADSMPANIVKHPVHPDVVQIQLTTPLAPNETVVIRTPFLVKLPYNFSRGGFEKSAFHVTQWYPKPAVYDQKGWHPMPYLDQGEFYSEFGDYRVSINVSDSIKVAATGIQTDSTSSNGRKTLTYQMEQAHDFAWFADSKYRVQKDTMMLNGKTILVQSYHYNADAAHGDSVISHIKRCIRFRSKLIGEYPYPIVTVVEKHGRGGGGMEYPTVTLIDQENTDKQLDLLIEHEVGHNWFYGILANNERENPWLDEGINSYYSARYEDLYYPADSTRMPKFLQKRLPENTEQLMLDAVTSMHRDQPIITASEDFSSMNYGLIAYHKASQWMKQLEMRVGTTHFDSCMQAYYMQHRFRHVDLADFKHSFLSSNDSTTINFAHLLYEQGEQGIISSKKLRGSFLFNLKDVKRHHSIQWLPVIGYNTYDKLMLGAVVHDFSLPGDKFQFIAIPLYATGTKQLNGLGRISLGLYPAKNANRLNIAINVAKFTNDSYISEDGKKFNLGWSKLVPELKYSWQSNNRSHHRRGFMQWKSFFINEDQLQFDRDSATAPYKISVSSEKRMLHQLRVVLSDTRVLYPYHIEMKAEAGKGFVRLGCTTDYFFNYPKGGGLQLRGFFGKFIYTQEKNFENYYATSRYHLNTTGANGYEDYTYSNYFIGRNEFEGFLSGQIMRKDGFFKIRTDLLSDKVGRTDNWLAAINLTTTIPKSINPLELLPLKIPIRLFADFGTTAKEGNTNTERILFDAGFQISLLKNTANIYFPVICSKSFRDYNRSVLGEKKFWKTVSFSIDLQQLKVNTFIPQLSF